MWERARADMAGPADRAGVGGGGRSSEDGDRDGLDQGFDWFARSKADGDATDETWRRPWW
jgi:hypothetical protein